MGLVRQSNQDNFAFREGTFVLADGMGGHQGGEVASFEATSTILESGKINSVADMVKSVSKANQAILKRAKKEDNLSGMGTTVCVLSEIVGTTGKKRIFFQPDYSFPLLKVGSALTVSCDLIYLLRNNEVSKELAVFHGRQFPFSP